MGWHMQEHQGLLGWCQACICSLSAGAERESQDIPAEHMQAHLLLVVAAGTFGSMTELWLAGGSRLYWL